MTTTAKVQARIVKHLETSNTMREAVTAAAWEATQEARNLGWSERTVRGLPTGEQWRPIYLTIRDELRKCAEEVA